MRKYSAKYYQTHIQRGWGRKRSPRIHSRGWTKLHTLLVILGSLVIFSGLGSLIYYFANNAKIQISNQ
ncbi:MAG: hypothetical protein LBC33_03240, partial [Mycoplasmataceae bacterium]|nr:hypothetical protein [Mycoplasmataceae bacterium]